MIIAKIKKLDGTELDHGKFESQQEALSWFEPFINNGVYGQKYEPATYRSVEVEISPAVFDENGVEVTPANTAIQQELVSEEILADFVIEYEQLITPNLEQQNIAEKWTEFRADRDSKLAACDFTQLADAPLTSAEKLEYRNYRTYLRGAPDLHNDTTILTATVKTFEEYKAGLL